MAHPVGEVPGSVVARFRMVDVLGHTWDLAQTIGVAAELPLPLCEAALDFLFPMLDELSDSQVFGPPITPPDGSPADIRFLALIGRDGTQGKDSTD